MVARTPPKQQQRKMAAAISPTRLRETIKKVDKCMARLQELQYTVKGGNSKVVSGVSLSPGSSRRSSLRQTSFRGKPETLRRKNANSRRSPPGKLPAVNKEEWQRMSLPAMLLGETMGEILQASQFARNMVDAIAVSKKQAPSLDDDDPKTPVTERRKQKPDITNPGVHSQRRRREKQAARSEPSPSPKRAKSRINFKATSPECGKENCRYLARRVSPRNRPWAKKTVLFPNPLFHSSPKSQHQKFCKTNSPVTAKNQQSTPQKFLVKSPNPAAAKFQVRIKSPPVSVSPKGLRKKSPKAASTVAKLRRSLSPARLANRLVSPLKSRKSVVQKSDSMKMMMSGLKQRPTSMSFRFSPRRI